MRRNIRYATVTVALMAMATAAHATVASQEAPPARESVKLQVPIDAGISMIEFISLDGSLIRLVTTNDVDPSGSLYASHTEYWSMAPMSVERNGPLAMEASQKELTAEEITDFLLPSTGWGPVVSISQVIGTSGWTQGTYVPTGAQKRLFKAVDPDDSNAYIGMLIEQDANDNLTRVTWYKTALTGTIFATTPSAMTFEQVQDSHGDPSVDPRDIDASATWYHASGP
ncbi:hypothetical protein [Polyangium aurulentum]|uniref:hypothetical protein n=1 Tax=Polyangium aurulentum TaxID=2567896 RepID=UPI0010ADFB98|nr:hypothetical protein [Polyangium aurulentum]UQA60538.1 hypothetical protein E8A73_008720 [Polyangium aurulentum]